MKNRRLVAATAIAHSNRELTAAAHLEFHSGTLQNSRFLTGRQKLKGRPEKWEWAAIEPSTIRKAEFTALCQWITFSRKADLKIGLAKHFKWNHIIHTFRVFDAKQLQVLTFRRCLRHQAEELCKEKRFCALNSDVIKTKLENSCAWLSCNFEPEIDELARFATHCRAVKSRTEQPAELKYL